MIIAYMLTILNVCVSSAEVRPDGEHSVVIFSAFRGGISAIAQTPLEFLGSIQKQWFLRGSWGVICLFVNYYMKGSGGRLQSQCNDSLARGLSP